MAPDDRGLDPDGRAVFEEAMRNVTPLSDRARTRRPGRAAARPLSSDATPGTAGLRSDGDDDRLEGLARGVSRRVIDRLRRGAIAVDESLDLHGLSASEARREVRRALAELWRRRQRCLLVIHGRGLRSEAGPVLKRALPSWLGESPWAARVRAFTSADSSRGGAGATLVYLRRRRR